MKHVVGFSGGIASAVMAKIVADEHRGKTVLLFHDTLTEPEDNDRFRCDISEFIGLPVTNDSDGRDIWELFRDQGFLGNGRNTPCSRILKQARSMIYMLDNQPATLYIGFTPDEGQRAQRTFTRYAEKGIKVIFPLIEQQLSKEECMHRVSNCWGIRPPEMYRWASHANCIPCIKGGLADWGLIYMFEREAWDRAVAAEKEFGHTIFTKYSCLEKELPRCLRLARQYLKLRDENEAQEMLFEYPCECMA
jgi:hypothetical protein